ncbi:CoA transferase [Pseudovibrio sp. Tun.PSC04-5.I4]|uniref:CoA transferase n=1 Tax=Pseudovibrio sp. Tun.PSC04-5.I4 TaxID=1798213 RepID=UPI00088E47EB|nr:CoA transferase [Pseudovibrio sp. Tun.PSC04-5.I4]SDR35041.1 CoA-transferase family III [Pseudovibrio sp. Tun.PSC04-5.I4]
MTEIFWNELSLAVFGANTAPPVIQYTGRLPGPLPVTELLAESVGLAGVALACLRGQSSEDVFVDGRLTAFWGLTSCEPIDWTPQEPWDPLSSIFKGRDGWIRLHTNAPHHKAVATSLLGNTVTQEDAAAEIANRSVVQLETDFIAAGGAAARLITWNDWQAHPQGRVISQSPLVEWSQAKPARAPTKLQEADYSSERPLSGLKVLDLTRVLAGPVATRTLAGYGAQVLRIDPADWDDPGLLHDTTIGKHCAELDLTSSSDRALFVDLLRQADVLVHGYRPGALEGLGFDAASLDQINPAHICISLSAYGRQGPWSERRGFDSLVQFSTGIADLCSDGHGLPGKLPVQALDHAAGYVIAACVFEALRVAKSGRIISAQTSLARIAWMLSRTDQTDGDDDPIPPKVKGDFASSIETSDWGNLKRLRPPLTVRDAPMIWDTPSGELRRHPASWD